MIRAFITLFAGLAGLAFGSFLNVCLSRWPAGESVVAPRSHCRVCKRTLTWWENVPLVSWIALGGRCRTCKSAISWRYPAAELAVGVLWASAAWIEFAAPPYSDLATEFARLASQCILLWLLIALAFLDAEHFWLPDKLTLPGIVLGFIATILVFMLRAPAVLAFYGASQLKNRMLFHVAWHRLAAIASAAALILLIRLVYWLIRRREGIGLGDAKLMALLAAWLGLPGALLSFVLGVTLGAAVAVVVLARASRNSAGASPAQRKLPLGTFLCIGGIVSSLWGQPILAAYLRWSGLN